MHSRKTRVPHDWRTREDPFEHTWPKILEWLETEPRITAKQLYERLTAMAPTLYSGAQLRNLQRRVTVWRADRARESVTRILSGAAPALNNKRFVCDNYPGVTSSREATRRPKQLSLPTLHVSFAATVVAPDRELRIVVPAAAANLERYNAIELIQSITRAALGTAKIISRAHAIAHRFHRCFLMYGVALARSSRSRFGLRHVAMPRPDPPSNRMASQK